MAVVVAHNWDPSLGPGILDRVNLGGLGVGLFFVLSGFLITGILLQGRPDGSASGNRPRFMKQFYVRRFLRIFPIYYLVLIGITILGSERSEVMPWLFTYTTNIYIWDHLTFLRFSHFWTLAVEEQFYLFWPLLLLFLRAVCRRRAWPGRSTTQVLMLARMSAALIPTQPAATLGPHP